MKTTTTCWVIDSDGRRKEKLMNPLLVCNVRIVRKYGKKDATSLFLLFYLRHNISAKPVFASTNVCFVDKNTVFILIANSVDATFVADISCMNDM